MAALYRWAALGFVLVSWAVVAVLIWRAFHVPPSAAELADAREVRPPLPAHLLLNLGQSAAVAAVLAAVLWPSWVRRYLLRSGIALLALIVWFVMTVPLDLNTMEWHHRRWLALMIVLLLFTLIVYPLLSRVGRREIQR